MTNSMVYLSALGVWFVFLVIAFGVGAVREGLLRPRIGEAKAHVIGTLNRRRLHDSRDLRLHPTTSQISFDIGPDLDRRDLAVHDRRL